MSKISSMLASMEMNFGISARPLESVLLDSETLSTTLEIIWADTRIAHESYQKLRVLIGRTSQARGEIPLTLSTDDSANRASALSEQELLGRLRAEGADQPCVILLLRLHLERRGRTAINVSPQAGGWCLVQC